MPTLGRPGVYVNEVDVPAYTTTSPTTTTACFIGANSQGPLTAKLCQSWTQFVSLYGNFAGEAVPSQLQLAVYQYFSNGGGGPIYVIRVAHSDAVVAANVLLDASTDTTITVEAANPGDWGNGLYVDVTHNTDGSFNLLVHVGSDASNTVVERWNNLQMNQASSYYFASLINNPLQGSALISVVDDQGTPTVPGAVPAVVAGVQLGTGSGSTPGVDGSVPVATDFTTTTTILDSLQTPLIINLPGIIDVANVLVPMINYVTTTRDTQDSIVLVDPPQGQNAASVIAYAQGLPTSSYAAIYYPWQVCTDPSSTVKGALKTIAPCAFVMGQISANDALTGVWQAPAGLQTNLSSPIATEITLSNSDLDSLNEANVNVIRYVKGAGICVMGVRTLSQQQNLRYLNVRRTLIYVEATALQLTQFATFQNNGPTLWSQIATRLSNFLMRLWDSGGLAGTSATNSFFVTCDETTNTATAIAQGQVITQIGVSPQTPAEYILLTVAQWSGGGSVTESTTAAPISLS